SPIRLIGRPKYFIIAMIAAGSAPLANPKLMERAIQGVGQRVPGPAGPCQLTGHPANKAAACPKQSQGRKEFRPNTPDGGRKMTKCLLYIAPIALIGLMATAAPAVPAAWSGGMARKIAVATADAKEAPRGGGGGRGGGGSGSFRGGGGCRG